MGFWFCAWDWATFNDEPVNQLANRRIVIAKRRNIRRMDGEFGKELGFYNHCSKGSKKAEEKRGGIWSWKERCLHIYLDKSQT